MKKNTTIYLLIILIGLSSFYIIHYEINDKGIISYEINPIKKDIKFYWKNDQGEN